MKRQPLLAAAAVGAAAVLAGSGMSYAAVAHYSGAVHRSDVFAGVTDRPVDDGGVNILLVGSDDRGSMSEEQRLQLHLGLADFGRNTDTILLVHIGDGGSVDVVSVPRDSALRIPAHTDPDGNEVDAAIGKVNSAYGAGGAGLLIQTVEDATDVRIDHYVEVDFAGFMAIVDALGGVEVCTPEPISDENSGLELPAGRTRVDGAQGLAYVRARYFDPTADVGRMGRQQAFLGAMFAQATSLGTLANPVRLDATAKAALESVTTDTGLDDEAVRGLAVKLQTTDPGKVRFATLPLAATSPFPTALPRCAGTPLGPAESSRHCGPAPAPSPTSRPQRPAAAHPRTRGRPSCRPATSPWTSSTGAPPRASPAPLPRVSPPSAMASPRSATATRRTSSGLTTTPIRAAACKPCEPHCRARTSDPSPAMGQGSP